MHSEARKLHIIEAVLRTDNEAVLTAIETIVGQPGVPSKRTKGRFNALLGALTNEEADAMKKTIEENFEKINPDDWK
ncbi:MAG: hypothetical protein J0H74_02655 [Chitinophagaceae bacterium]|nr:hypothetical protein [Chitinophagaceae bacterium]